MPLQVKHVHRWCTQQWHYFCRTLQATRSQLETCTFVPACWRDTSGSSTIRVLRLNAKLHPFPSRGIGSAATVVPIVPDGDRSAHDRPRVQHVMPPWSHSWTPAAKRHGNMKRQAEFAWVYMKKHTGSRPRCFFYLFINDASVISLLSYLNGSRI